MKDLRFLLGSSSGALPPIEEIKEAIFTVSETQELEHHSSKATHTLCRQSLFGVTHGRAQEIATEHLDISQVPASYFDALDNMVLQHWAID